MKFLVVGAGSIGKRHMRNLLSIGYSHSDIAAVDTRVDRQQELKDLLGINAIFSSLDDALAASTFDAAIVCSPTSCHIPQAIQLAKSDVHIMMEKPLAHDLEGIDTLKTVVADKNLTVLMAYIFRFSPLTKKLKELIDDKTIGKILSARGEFSEYLPDWHPYEDYRSFYMAKKSTGGGSILDQSHIVDLIHYVLGGFESVFALNPKISDLEIEADDLAEMVVTLKNGAIASIHTDIFGRDHKKYLEIKGAQGNILWDFYSNSIRVYNPDTKSAEIFQKFPTDFNLVYLEELNHFIACCQGKQQPIASLNDGIETMELILAAEKSHKTLKMEKVGA